LCFKIGLYDLNELATHLKLKDLPDLPAEVARVTSTNHSFFFREPEVLNYFKQKVIPTLPDNNKWRIWSAASAAGEEAYTLAIMLAETLGVNQALSQAAILGTDISYPMITQAEQGIITNKSSNQLTKSSCIVIFTRKITMNGLSCR
jgi:chemotaxis protein methyltransferase CheR